MFYFFNNSNKRISFGGGEVGNKENIIAA
uniref:Uncharacterized protein n=1 Tax=Rhizophora mucronata TaxID=61149 RepID=A0A2P2KGJ3_RHIMU